MKIKIEKIAPVIVIGFLLAYTPSSTMQDNLKLSSGSQQSPNSLVSGNGTDIVEFSISDGELVKLLANPNAKFATLKYLPTPSYTKENSEDLPGWTKHPNSVSVLLNFIPLPQYDTTVDKETGIILPVIGKNPPGMADDGMYKTPNGIRYKEIFKEGKIGRQYIQPDGNYAKIGEAIRLPSGGVYQNKKKSKILYQEGLISLDSATQPVNIDEIDDESFDFGY
jgi:hypothetical protein